MDLSKIATEQGSALLVGAGAVAVIQPTTPGGYVWIVLFPAAAINAIIFLAKRVLSKRPPSGPANYD